ncbi:MAG TPA: hypothetical protein VK548_06815 [Candidatus Acidoferrum sp.]|nr:hypothetical protein [Candidatus Acidoferrum sp.]
MADLSIGVAGLRTVVVVPDPEVATVVRERFGGFLSSGAPAWRIDITTTRGDLPSFEGVDVKRDGTPARFSVKRRDFSGIVDLGARRADVALTDPDNVSSDVSIESILRIVYSLALVETRGLVVHAASLMRDEGVYLFCGPSGSGKTTVARLSTDATVLSDELSIVRVVEDHGVCFGTPFRGELALAGADLAGPLVGIYFLHHGPRHAVEALGPRQALGRLLPNVLFFAREADVTAEVFRIAADLVEVVPCFDLSFRPDHGFWEVIRNA